MENELKVASPLPPAREIGVITAEIKSLQQQANTVALMYAIEIGRRLEEAKSVLPYGEWGKWLAEEVDFSQSTANNFMRLFKEYGSDQISIFGSGVNSQTFANLPYSKALLLLAVPKEERETFAAEVGAEDLSVKELQAAVEDKKRAEQLEAEQTKLKAELEEKVEEVQNAEKKLSELKAKLDEELKKQASLKEKLDKVQKNPTIPKDRIDEIRNKAVKEAEEQVKKELEASKAKIEAAEKEALKARLAEKFARENLEAAEKKLKTASPGVTEFKVLFDNLQETFKKIEAKIKAIYSDDDVTAKKLCDAINAFGRLLAEFKIGGEGQP